MEDRVNKTRLNVDIDEELHFWLKGHAIQNRRKLNDLIPRILKAYRDEVEGAVAMGEVTLRKASGEDSRQDLWAESPVEIVPGYYSAANEIIEPDKVLMMTRYFVRRWMPILGENGTRIVLALRSLGYYNRQTGEKRDGSRDRPAGTGGPLRHLSAHAEARVWRAARLEPKGRPRNAAEPRASQVRHEGPSVLARPRHEPPAQDRQHLPRHDGRPAP